MGDSLHTAGHDLLLASRAIPALLTARYRELAVGSLGAVLLYSTLVVAYRLFLSPIARFPGPKLAAATEWYEFYFQLIKDGQWGRQVERLHEKYGKR
jgi:hypothetical protein